jgi:hypothetical protein
VHLAEEALVERLGREGRGEQGRDEAGEETGEEGHNDERRDEKRAPKTAEKNRRGGFPSDLDRFYKAEFASAMIHEASSLVNR